MLPRSLDDIRGLRAARWIRESTTGQYDNYGPDSQRKQQDLFIERHGLVDTGLVWQVAQSGTTVWRSEAMAEMIESAKAGAFDLLLTGYSDRWQRNLRRTLELLEDGLHPAGVALVMCDRRIVSSDPRDWDELISEAHQADKYSRRLGERITDGYAAKFQRLGDQAGNAPRGLRRGGEAHTLETDPDTIGDVVQAFERYAMGNVTHDMLADDLGVGVEQVRKVLRNPIYNGWAIRHRGRDRAPAPWRDDPPVSDQLWERVQEQRSMRTRGGPQPGRWRRGVDPLGGLLWCPCGARIRTNGTAGQPKRRQRMHPAPLCSDWGKFGYVWGAAHDAPIEQQVSRLRLDEATIERVVRAVGDEQEAEVPAALNVSRVARRRRQLALEHAAGALTDDEYLSATHALADQAPDPVKHERVTGEEAVAYLRDLGQLWAEATVQERSDLLHAIYARITVTRDGFESVELTPDAYAHGLALSMRESVSVLEWRPRQDSNLRPAA
jgi:hypothetical protein